MKTGFTVGPGGASGLLGATSDLVCVAKAMGGGLSTSAIGGGEVMELVARGDYQQVGTFNGNPLAMAAARAMLTEVLTDDGVRPPRPPARSGCATASRPSSTGTTRRGWS